MPEMSALSKLQRQSAYVYMYTRDAQSACLHTQIQGSS